MLNGFSAISPVTLPCSMTDTCCNKCCNKRRCICLSKALLLGMPACPCPGADGNLWSVQQLLHIRHLSLRSQHAILGFLQPQLLLSKTKIVPLLPEGSHPPLMSIKLVPCSSESGNVLERKKSPALLLQCDIYLPGQQGATISLLNAETHNMGRGERGKVWGQTGAPFMLSITIYGCIGGHGVPTCFQAQTRPSVSSFSA